MAMSDMFHLFLVSLFISLATPTNGSTCIDTERQALLSIKAGIQLSNNQSWLSSWQKKSRLTSWTGHDCCNWPGVACNNVTSHVIKLDLRQYPYELLSSDDFPPSKLDSSLSQLHHLKHLDLSSNNFNNAPIPDFIGSLANLEYLNLSIAGFGGVIPHEALGNLSNLQFLDISGSYLSTDNLHWLSGMTRLQHLDLSDVDLSMVSHWIHQINMLPSLLVLKLSFARLQAGGIHDTTLLHHLNFTSLRVLDLSQNYDLNTTLPGWLFQLRGLIHLDLSYCNFYGNLPVSIGNLSRLTTLLLASDRFGVIPESLGNLTELVSLDLSENMITKLPNSIGRLHKLERFDLPGNHLTGRIPQGIWELRNLQFLDLSSNMLSGEIPEAFGNLTLLQQFDSRSNKLSCKLPETIGNLVHLQFLDLSRNVISGKLPESLGNLSQLQTMKMTSNGITGPLPESTGKLSSLRELDLSQNNITGTLPKGMGNLCKLQSLTLDNNSISGDINDLVDGLSKCRENNNSSDSGSGDGLSTLTFGNNKLNGTISVSIGQLSKLNALRLSSNSLAGVLTESHFANLANLEYVDFSYNSLQLNVSVNWKPHFDCNIINMRSCRVGPAFPAWLRTQTHLGELRLPNAGISGSIPEWFWNLTSKRGYILDLSNNNLEGSLPTTVKKYLFTSVDLSSNRFEGLIPEFEPSELTVLDLTNNSFSGPIPTYFGNATYTQVFSLAHNHINGSIPSFFCNLTSMALLDLSNNDMSGGIPHCWNSTSVLEIVDFSNNNFTGEIPDGLTSLTNLRFLHLRNNGFYGDLPLSLKMAKKLVTLDVGENKLSGSIPTWLGENLSSLVVLRLRSNLFDGIIPEQLSKLFSLQILDLAHNNLSGCIPHSFGDFKAMADTNHNEWWSLLPIVSDVYFAYSYWGKVTNTPNTYGYSESLLITAKGLQIEYKKILSLVTSMDLSNNKLSCQLPEELTKLHGLHFLNLSGNLFNGRIPENIGDMKQLESLDLSKNNLSGVIPSSISTLNFLGHLNLSHNSLSGKIPSGGQIQTFDPSAYNWNNNLCGPPLQNCVNETHTRSSKEEEGNKDQSEMLWLYVSFALGFIIGFWMFIGTIIIKQTIRITYFRSIDATYDWVYVKTVLFSRRIKSKLSS